MYEQLADALGMAEEPFEAARAALEALRDPTPEVLAAGITATQWSAAIDAMLANADRIDRTAEVEAIAARIAGWPALRKQLEGLGCGVWQPDPRKQTWRIEAAGVHAEIDLDAGDIKGLWFCWREDPFELLVERVREKIGQRREKDAVEARKAELRKTHTWSNARKGWVPKSGVGPILRGGASAK